MDNLYWFILSIPAIIIASTIHEFAHAYTAYKLGDPTAKMMDRLSLNPLKHIDPLGAIAMVLFHFGWSKPVPINESYFRNPILGTALVSIAGPLSNLLMACICALLNLLPLPDAIQIFVYVFAIVNISLAVFNLLPIAPLDGHKIVRALPPKNLRLGWEKLERYSWILIVLLLVPYSPVDTLISGYISSTLNFFLNTLGFY
jgi:Zn-dependent protease